MECLLCNVWDKMPYGKRYTTPTSVGETEGALVIGYWTATRQVNGVVRLCERHMSVVKALDTQEEQKKSAEIQQEEARKKTETQKPADHTLDLFFQQRLAEVRQRKEELIASAQPTKPADPFPNYQGPFVLGPGPLSNPNALIANQSVQPAIQVALSVPQVPNPDQHVLTPLNPNLPQAAAQGAALIDAPCLFCKVMVMTGEIHNCPQAGARGN